MRIVKCSGALAVALAGVLLAAGTASWAQQAKGSAAKLPHAAVQSTVAKAKIVAYDAKDKRYYSVAYAKAHHMHDKGGDKLILIPRSHLPKEAKLSHAMKGVEP